jgi:membrane protein implicated in regulation of membrane protease activity
MFRRNRMNEPWFLWALAGIVCIGLEMLLPGFVIFFFGLGGLLTALCCLVPFIGDQTWIQVILFMVFSVGSLVVFRRKFTKIFAGTVFDSKHGNDEADGIGKTAEVLETAGPVVEGRIKFQGTSWKAHTKDGECTSGSIAKIVSREGMTYIIEPIPGGSASEGAEK